MACLTGVDKTSANKVCRLLQAPNVTANYMYVVCGLQLGIVSSVVLSLLCGV